VLWQTIVPTPTIGVHRGTRNNDIAYERYKVCARRVRNVSHSEASETFWLTNLNGDRYDRFGSAAPPLPAVLDATEQGFVNLHVTRQTLSFGTHHRNPEPLKHGPRHTIPGAKRTLEGFRRQPILGGGQVPSGLEPGD